MQRRRIFRSLEFAMLLFAPLLMACGDQPLEQPGIRGSWEWLSAQGGIAGLEMNPETAGYTATVRFLEGERVELWRNGSLDRATFFTLVPGSDPEAELQIHYDEPLLGFPVQTLRLRDSGDRMFLVDACCDGFAYEFVRVD